MRVEGLACAIGILVVSFAGAQVPAPPQARSGSGLAQTSNAAQPGNAAQRTSDDNFSPGVLERSALPTARALDYDFDDVQIATILGWLRRIGVEPPVALGGRVSGWVWAQAPARGWWRLSDYRVEGELTSPLLDIDRFSIRTAQVRFGYRQGLWTVGRALGQIESRLQAAESRTAASEQPSGADRRVLGQANLSGQLPMSATAAAHFQGTLQRVGLPELLASLGLKDNLPSGIAQGTFAVDTAVAQLSQPLKWRAQGHIRADQVRLGELPPTDFETDWQLADAQLALTGGRAMLLNQTLQLAARLQLTDQFAWNVQLPQQSLTLSPDLYQALQLPTEADALPAGVVQLAGNSAGQLAPWGAEYHLNLASNQLVWFRNALANLSARLSLTADGVRIEQLTTQVAGGSLSGEGRWPVEPTSPVTVDLNYQQLDLSQLSAPVELPAMQGIVSGSARATLDSSQLQNLNSAAVDVAGTGAGVRIAQWGFGRIEYTLAKQPHSDAIAIGLKDAGTGRRWAAAGTLRPMATTDAPVDQAANRPPTASASPAASAPAAAEPSAQGWAYDIQAHANRLDLSFAELVRLLNLSDNPPELIQFVLATGQVTMRGDTAAGLAATTFDLSNVTALQRGGGTWAVGSLAGRTSPTLVQIDRGDFQIGGGTVHVETTWNFKDEGTDRLRLLLERFSLSAVRSWDLIAVPKNIEGVARADIDVQRPAGGNQSLLAGWIGALDVAVDDFVYRGQPVGSLRASGQLGPEKWDTQVVGDVFEAPLSGNLEIGIDQQPSWSVAAVRGSLTWLGGAAERLLALWQSRDQAAQWRGLANVRAEIDWQRDGEKTGFVRVEVPQLAYQGRPIARAVAIDAALNGDQLRLVRFEGGVGGGRVDVSGAYDFRTGQAQGLIVDLQRISLEEAVHLIDPKMSLDVTGRADVRARVRIVDGVSMHGSVRLRDALLYKVPVDEAHSDFELSTSPNYSTTRLRARNVRGRAFGGRLDGELDAHVGTRKTFSSRVRIERGEVELLSQWAGTSSVVGRGKFDAAMAIGAARFESTRDLQGRLDFSFEDTDARTLPVADQLARFVPLFGLPSTEFERGRMVGFISRGDLRMRSLALWGPQLSVLGNGNIGLGSGRLDLQLVVRVGGGLSQQIASSYLSQLAATSIPPVELLLQINRLVANRAIFLRVAGTASKPVIQPQTGRIIEQALLRTLLEQAAPIASVAIGAPVGTAAGASQ